MVLLISWVKLLDILAAALNGKVSYKIDSLPATVNGLLVLLIFKVAKCMTVP